MPKTWEQLKHQAESKHPENRVDAVIKAKAKVEKFLPSGNHDYNMEEAELIHNQPAWPPEIKWAVTYLRNKVVHNGYDPTIEETLKAVRTFFEYWQKHQTCDDEEDSTNPLYEDTDEEASLAWENMNMPKTWGQLEHQAENEHPEYRVDAIVKAKVKVEGFLPTGSYDRNTGEDDYSQSEWPPEIKWAVMSIRNKVVHNEYDPTIEETLKAIRIFFEYWRKQQIHSNVTEEDDRDEWEKTEKDLEEIAKIYDKRDIPEEDWHDTWNTMEEEACSSDTEERTKAVLEAYEEIKTLHIGNTTENLVCYFEQNTDFETALNKSYEARHCEMKCDEAARWAHLLAEHIKTKNYKPSIVETHRAVHIFREIWDILTISDHSSNDDIDELYQTNFASEHPDASPASIYDIVGGLSGHYLSLRDLRFSIEKSTAQLGISVVERNRIFPADLVVLIERTHQIELFK